jgi:hypothetical protein
VQWIEADIVRAALPVEVYDVWHDRAVFHFLTSKPSEKCSPRHANRVAT